MSLLSIFATAILPIVAVALVGAVLGRAKDVDPDPLNTVVIYVLAPALVFHSLAGTDLGGAALLRVAGGVTAYTLLMIGVAEAVARLLGIGEPLRSALVLVSAFPNSGNYGLPVSEFAFGAAGRSTAVLYLTVQGVLLYTVGVYVAARGSDGASRGLVTVFRLPLVYAVAAALVARRLGLVPPEGSTAMATVGLVGEAAIPVMLVILGIQLANTDYGAVLGRVGLANVLKMGVAPLVGVGVALLLGFERPAVARTFVLECAMPAAVTPLILVVEFGGETGTPGDAGAAAADGGPGDPTAGARAPSVAEYVSTVVLTTTLVSVPLLTVVIALLQSGLVL